jgi:hypothetical protein
MTMARQSRKVAEALKTYYEGIFYELMIGMVKAKSYEADYARFGEEARSLTKRQLRQIAQYASEFFTSHSSNPAKLSTPAENSPLCRLKNPHP